MDGHRRPSRTSGTPRRCPDVEDVLAIIVAADLSNVHLSAPGRPPSASLSGAACARRIETRWRPCESRWRATMSAYYPIPCHPLLACGRITPHRAGSLLSRSAVGHDVWGTASAVLWTPPTSRLAAASTAGINEAARAAHHGQPQGIDADPSLTGLSNPCPAGELLAPGGSDLPPDGPRGAGPGRMSTLDQRDLVTTVLQGPGFWGQKRSVNLTRPPNRPASPRSRAVLIFLLTATCPRRCHLSRPSSSARRTLRGRSYYALRLPAHQRWWPAAEVGSQACALGPTSRANA